MSNAWIIYLWIGDNIAKAMLIPDDISFTSVNGIKDGLLSKLLSIDESAYH